MSTNYSTYNQNDFLADEFFIQWVKYRTPDREHFWNNWINSQPGNLKAMQDAKLQLELILSAKRIVPAPSDEIDVWQHITNAIDAEPVKIVPVNSRRKWLIAASIAILLSAGGIWWFGNNRAQTVKAGYGQLVTLSLPDASVVKLNANSEVRYLKTWNNGQPREIYLKGEAFFTVAHINSNKNSVAPHERFLVHTDHLLIEVLGTSFNVKERRNKTAVSLEHGSLKVQLEKDSLQQFLLQPGELAEYDTQTGKLIKTKREPAYSKDWTENKILASNTTVAEIVADLEDLYGYDIILEDPSLAKRTIDGTIPLKNESNVLFILSNILDVNIEQKNNQVIFKTRK